MFTPVEIEKQLNTLEILVDTREHEGRLFINRCKQFGCPWKRYKLDFGDYSGAYTDIKGNYVTLEKDIVIERKMNLNELANCFTRERERFEREFMRAKENGAAVYLLIETDTWQDAYNGTYGLSDKYRSKFLPKSMVASINSWESRYGFRTRFCDKNLTGKMIKDIIFYHIKNKLLEQI